MDLREWALILFTVLMQACVGSFLLTVWFDQRTNDSAARKAYQSLNLFLIPVAVVALAASLGHLGRPLQALSSLSNLGSSWLSREIFFTGAFSVLLVLAALLKGNPGARRIVAWLAALAGVAGVVSMAMIYNQTMKPAWQGFGTFVAFAATTLFLGAALAAAMLAGLGRTYQDQTRDLKDLAWVAVGVALLEVVAVPLQMAGLAGGDSAAQATAGLLAGPYASLLVLRWVLAILGGVLALVLALRRLSLQQIPSGLLYTAGVAILAGELLGRYLFYATAVSIGIG
ncbi:dimethyl sulfoxide reductase anchor subunit family protein [Limnochorda pilosa]|uniref:DMSO reductase subunit C n=1 Tax=Limnochorda pilosa TaxID=1555112 RepID=A0A0K2SGL3_LIMPI|nr:DmsC/YnfH family molybdoenzyme membrane anchor subunit [Limnochorda pilosa]BAS26230.1 DMSO reductase subunit C [Limnochorda pilosa]